MGSWSVCCGLSNISIVYGNRCCVLPIRKTKANVFHLHLPCTLPIFGEYNDYGNIENVIRDENVKLIETHFGCSIEQFLEYITREAIWGDTDLKEEDFKNFGELSQYEFMFIDAQVYEFLSTFKGQAFHSHSLEMGNADILTYFGFKNMNKRVKGITPYDISCRHEYDVWDFNGKTFYANGIYLYTDTPNTEPLTKLVSVYANSENNFANLSKYVSALTDTMLKHTKSSTEDLWFVLNKTKKVKVLLEWLACVYEEYTRDILDIEEYKLRINEIKKSKGGKIFEKEIKVILQRYEKDIDKFGDDFAKLHKLLLNMRSYSMFFQPHTICATPQCGEYEDHQKILEKFAEINKSYLSE